MAKGGGSANKTFLHQGTPSLLKEDLLLEYLDERITALGTAACPPYHLAVVIGGTSAESNLKTVKLPAQDILTISQFQEKRPVMQFDVLNWKKKSKDDSKTGDRCSIWWKIFLPRCKSDSLPRHGASLPIGIGVSCSADRQALGKITKDGVFL